MSDKILVEYQVEVDGLKAQMKEVQTTMKETEKVGKDSAKGVGDEFKKTEDKTKSLKAQLRELKAQLANTTDPKEFNRLAAAAGELQDKINDASDATKAFAKESKASTAKTLFSQIAGDIAQLDFKGAADKAKQFSAVMSSITFAETLSGVKSLGIALFEMGKALLLNPLFLLAATIIAVGKATYDATVFMIDYGKESKIVTDVINEQSKAQKTFTDRILESQIAIKETLGIYTKFQAEQKRTAIKNSNELVGIEKEKNAKIKELADSLGIDLVKGEAKIRANINPFHSQAADLLNLEKFKKERIKIEESYAASLRIAKLSQQTDSAKLQIADNAERAKIAKDAIEKNRQKQLEDKAKQEQLDRAIAEKRLEIQRTFQGLYEKEKEKEKVIEDKSIADSTASFKKKSEDVLLEAKRLNKELADAEKQADADALKAEEDAAQQSLRIEREKQDAIKQLQQEAFNATQSLAMDAFQIQQNRISQELSILNEQKNAEISSLDEQLSKKIISQEQYDAKKKALDDKNLKREKELKIKAFDAQKQASIIYAIISTASGIATALTGDPYTVAARVALAAAIGAAQIAVIESQPTPKFEKGGKVKGKLHSQGGTLIEAEKDEWIIKRNESIKNNDLLSAINKGKGKKFIYEMYVAPALKEQLKKHNQSKDSSFASNIANSMLLNSGNFKDGNILESLKMQRKADKENIKYLAKVIQQNNYNARNW